jgi:uncharacterized phage protein gp47/JayE
MAVKAWIDEDGVHIPSYPEVLEDLKNEFRNIYGQDTYLEPDSQDGQLCAVFALRIYDCYTLAASVYNAYSPHTAQGVGLSSVVKVNGIRRQSSSYSHVALRLIGQAGTTITGGIVADEAGKRWLLPEAVAIPLSGEIKVTALAEQEGDVRAAPGEIIHIVTKVRGWQSVENPEAARPGAPVEHDALLRRRQAISTMLPSRSIFDGTAGAVAQVPGVSRSRGYENDTSRTDSNGIPPHSICFVVEGGDTQAIGEIIAIKKGPGCGTYGDVTVLTYDLKGVPSQIRFYRPTIVDVAVLIRIKPLDGYLAVTGERILWNVFAYLAELRIGDDLLLSKLYTPINAAEQEEGKRTFDVVEIRVGPRDGELAPQNMPIAFNAAVSCAMEDITLREY